MSKSSMYARQLKPFMKFLPESASHPCLKHCIMQMKRLILKRVIASEISRFRTTSCFYSACNDWWSCYITRNKTLEKNANFLSNKLCFNDNNHRRWSLVRFGVVTVTWHSSWPATLWSWFASISIFRDIKKGKNTRMTRISIQHPCYN